MNFSNALSVLAVTAGTVESATREHMNSQIFLPLTKNKRSRISNSLRYQRKGADELKHHSFRGIKKRFLPEDPSIKVVAADAGVLPLHRPKNEDVLSGERRLDWAVTCEAGYIECDNGMAVIDGIAIPCKEACRQDDGTLSCCNGNWWYEDYFFEGDACRGFSGKVCKDGSCRGGNACRNANIDYVVNSCIDGWMDSATCQSAQIYRAVNSCNGYYSCLRTEANYVSNSCNLDFSCYDASVCGDIVDSCNTDCECLDLQTYCDPPLERVGDNGNPSLAFPLGQCQGDCDDDNDCQGDLVCFVRDGPTADAPVPFCTGYDNTGDDFCTKRPNDEYLAYVGNDGNPQDRFPLQKCEGDCDNDSECDTGLSCFIRNQDTPNGGGVAPVPGCEGRGVRGKDYCYLN